MPADVVVAPLVPIVRSPIWNMNAWLSCGVMLVEV
jgi:hypothetical protein